MKVRIKHKGEVLSEDILLATNLYTRMIGLMFRSSPPESSKGLMIEPCNSIHTCFMRYALDIVFLDSKNQVIKVIRNIRPWRMTWIYFKASKTLELPAGNLPLAINEGDYLEVEDV
jgi:uncharacterized protein